MKLFDLVSVELTFTGPWLVLSYSALEHGAVLVYDLDALKLASDWQMDVPLPVAKFTSMELFQNWLKNKVK